MKKLNLVYLIALTIITSTFSQSTFAQDAGSEQLKLYTNFAWQSSERTVGFDTIVNRPINESYFESDLGYFSPAFSWATDKGNRHEIELSRLQFNQVRDFNYIEYNNGINPQVVSGEGNTKIFIALRYEFDYQLFKSKDNKLKPSLGFAVRPYFSNASFRPKLATQFASSEMNIGALFSIVPRLTYDLNKKLFMDLNVPLNLARLGIRSTTWDNPAIPVSQRKVNAFDAKTLPSEYLIRLGIGLRL
ncbi:MAG: hypothetical protein ACI8ZM_002890 [Crocinitomix sp.]|jgi:hypothetical protein